MFLNPFAKLGQSGHELRGVAVFPSAALDFLLACFANGFFHEIPFVDNDDAGFAFFNDFVGDFLVLLGNSRFGIEDKNGNVTPGDGILGAFDAEEFDRIIDAPGLAHASSVDENIRLANSFRFYFERDVNRIASRAGNRADDDAGGLGQGVYNGGFADVWTADDG